MDMVGNTSDGRVMMQPIYASPVSMETGAASLVQVGQPLGVITGSPIPSQPPEHIMQFFRFEHLPPHLQDVSRPFGELAELIVKIMPRNPERTVALRKLLESKDAAVRALVAK